MAYSQNSVLDTISRLDRRVQSRLRPFTFKRGDLLAEIGQSIDEVFFPESGLISVVVPLNSGDVVETAIIGHRGLLGGGAAFGEPSFVHTGVGQLPGSGQAMRAEHLREITDAHASVRALIFAHQQFLLAQAQQSAACNAKHHIPGRLATWLLRARDAIGKDEVDLTQEFVAEMLGVQRPSVSIVAAQLQDAGLISYSRGRVKIIDEQGLADAACECHVTLRRHYQRLFARQNGPVPAPEALSRSSSQQL